MYEKLKCSTNKGSKTDAFLTQIFIENGFLR